MAEVVWQIGDFDAGPSQFSSAWFTAANQPEPVFTIGQSQPRDDWPRRHPGPLDATTGFAPHTATVRFDARVDPSVTWFELRLYIYASQGPTPELEVLINGRRGMFLLDPVRPDRERVLYPPSPAAGWADLRIPI